MPFPAIGFNGVKKKIVLSICAVVHFLMSILHVSRKWIYNKCKESSCRYNSIPTKRMGYFCGIKPLNNFVSIEDLYPLREVPFEDISIMVPKDIEKMLTMCYGDFMQLPPPDQRKNHFPLKLDFGDSM
jgi:lipopolysaccharide cholinephosphotransferase